MHIPIAMLFRLWRIRLNKRRAVGRGYSKFLQAAEEEIPQDTDTKSFGFPSFSQLIVVKFFALVPFPCVNSCVLQMLNYSVMSMALSLHPLCLIITVALAMDHLK